MFKTHKDGSQPSDDQIFVFGSNLAGVHGAGAARAACQLYGAKWGQGYGLSGRSFAIPTKDKQIETLSLSDIEDFVMAFATKLFDKSRQYFFTRVGCGLAGYSDDQIAPIFAEHFRDAKNIDIPEGWLPYFQEERRENEKK